MLSLYLVTAETGNPNQPAFAALAQCDGWEEAKQIVIAHDAYPDGYAARVQYLGMSRKGAKKRIVFWCVDPNTAKPQPPTPTQEN